MEAKEKSSFIRIAEEKIPVHKFLGLKVLSVEKGYVRVSVPFRTELVGDIRRNRWHGGIIATVMDSVGGMIGTTFFTSMKDSLSTIDLRVDYLKGADASSLIVEGDLVRLGNRIMVIRMRALQEGELVAEGKGVYNFIKSSRSSQ
ncbi:hotdog fold thioesterase [Robertkochia aurantiaca]|uniref:hotdog fold thioesterase n=1 Tax=Robertkochia aurantiaca TaxID=2873700 RepID=UPI001CC97CC0|nr:hotdog fold thioesterase [Robertkochia sp. 3YJGBD-33]